jgi:hypothetical protein
MGNGDVKILIYFFYYCFCTVYFDNIKIPFTYKCTLILKHKMLKRTVKISLCLLLHVSVQLDHPQGAYGEPC